MLAGRADTRASAAQSSLCHVPCIMCHVSCVMCHISVWLVVLVWHSDSIRKLHCKQQFFIMTSTQRPADDTDTALSNTCVRRRQFFAQPQWVKPLGVEPIQQVLVHNSVRTKMYGYAVSSRATRLPVPVLLKLDTLPARENGFDCLFMHALIPTAC